MLVCLRTIFLGALLFFAAPALAETPITLTLTVDGLERQALVFVPPDVPATNVQLSPVIFGFHGHGGTMQAAAAAMHFEDFWTGAIVVYPQGLPMPGIKLDPEGLHPGWQFVPGGQGDRDLHFFDALLAKLRQDYHVNDKRIYAAGFSNGAFFSYLLWSQRASQLAAFGICAGSILPQVQLTMPRSLITVSGRHDPLVPFADQMQSVEVPRTLDGATGAGQACGLGCTRYAGTGNLKVVTLIHNGGHVFPPAAAPRMVAFFQSQSLP
jgi:polyhydroxybutyrate depolymerase